MFREMRITRTIRTITAIFMAVVMLAAACVSTSYAAEGGEIPARKVIFPENVTLKVGEQKTLEVKTDPANTTYLMNIQWGRSGSGYFSYKSNGSGSYWGKPSSVVLTGIGDGTGKLSVTVKMYDSNKNYITSYSISTTVNVIKSGSTSQDEPVEPQLEKYRDKITFTKSLSKQTLTVKGTAHAYKDATKYIYTLRKGSANGKELYTKRSISDAVNFTQLNVGETYHVTVQEGREDTVYTGTARSFTVTPDTPAFKVYTKRTTLGKAIENTAIKRGEPFTVYYTGRGKDARYFYAERPLLALYWSCIAKVEDKALSYPEKNKYDENIMINGKRCYKYKFGFKYRYTKKQHEKFVAAIKKRAKALTGSSTNKVKQFNNYVKSTKYDKAERDRCISGHPIDGPTSSYSAYSLLIKGKAVCQGQADAAAIVLSRAGVKCESVGGKNLRTGNGHAWNIVKRGNLWYWCDFTYGEYLQGSAKFNKHHKLDKKAYKEQMSRVGKIAA